MNDPLLHKKIETTSQANTDSGLFVGAPAAQKQLESTKTIAIHPGVPIIHNQTDMVISPPTAPHTAKR